MARVALRRRSAMPNAMFVNRTILMRGWVCASGSNSSSLRMSHSTSVSAVMAAEGGARSKKPISPRAMPAGKGQSAIDLFAELDLREARQRRSRRDGAKQDGLSHRPHLGPELVEEAGGALVRAEYVLQVEQHKVCLVKNCEYPPNYHFAGRE